MPLSLKPITRMIPPTTLTAKAIHSSWSPFPSNETTRPATAPMMINKAPIVTKPELLKLMKPKPFFPLLPKILNIGKQKPITVTAMPIK